MKKKLQFILINTLILIGSHSAFSMNNTEEGNLAQSSRVAPLQSSNALLECVSNSPESKNKQYSAAIERFETGSEEDKSRIFSFLLETIQDPQISALDRLRGAEVIFHKGTLEQQAEGFIAGGKDFCAKLVSEFLQFSPEIKEHTCSALTHILQNQTPPPDRIRAGQLLLKFGTPHQKEASVSTLMTLAQSSISLKDRMRATFYIFRDGPLEQKVAVFSAGGMDFHNELLSLIPKFSPRSKEHLCSTLSHVLESPSPPPDRIRAWSLLLIFGAPQQQQQSISALMASAKSSSSREDRMFATFYIFRDGPLEHKAAAFSVGGKDFHENLLSWFPKLSPESKEYIRSALTHILKNKIPLPDCMRAGHLLLKFGTPHQKETIVSSLIASVKSSNSLEERMHATFYVFCEGTPEQKAAIFTAGGMDFCNKLLSWFPKLSPEIKDLICSNLTHILESNAPITDRIHAGQLLLNFGTPQQKEASIALMSSAQS